MRETIGEKSLGDIFISLFLFLTIGGITFVIYRTEGIPEDSLDQFKFYVMVGAIVITFFLTIHELMKPHVMIECDRRNLYLNYRHHSDEIPLQEIVQAQAKRARARAITYSYGKITIHTTKDTHRIGNVAKCEDVALRIMRLVNTAKEDREEE